MRDEEQDKDPDDEKDEDEDEDKEGTRALLDLLLSLSNFLPTSCVEAHGPALCLH